MGFSNNVYVIETIFTFTTNNKRFRCIGNLYSGATQFLEQLEFKNFKLMVVINENLSSEIEGYSVLR